MKCILILGGSGFIGHALYKDLAPYYNVHATYLQDNKTYEKDRHFHQWDMEMHDVHELLRNIHPDYIVSALRGNVNSQIHTHMEVIKYLQKNECRMMFLSSANVFDRFTNYPSYEYDKTLSESIYGRFKIKIENALLRLPPKKFIIARLPMIFGWDSPRVKTLYDQLRHGETIEAFPNVVINATYIDKLALQMHYLINRRRRGVFHLGSRDLIHHMDLIQDISKVLGYPDPKIKQVYDSNEDRQLAVLPKENLLPKHLQLTIEEVVKSCRRPQ